MKRNLLFPGARKALLAVPAAAMMLGAASHGAEIGINFQDNWGGTPYAPLNDAAGAFGIPLANWYNAPTVFNSGPGAGVGTNGTFAVPGGGDLNVAWACQNTWSLTADIPTFGDDQVIYGYLDDPAGGYTVTLRGLRAFASSFTITTIASTDGGSEFMPVTVFSKTETNTVEYLNNYAPSFASGLAGTSTVSTVFATLNGNDSVTIRGLSKTNSQIRSTLAGILISYTAGGNNPPLIESNPQTPPGILFPGSSFILNSTASGSPTLAYQWRKGGNNIPGATFASYTNTSAVVGDTGDYDVVVTNSFGSVTSAVAVVTIQNVTAPVITQAPLSQSLYQGYPAAFTVVATGGQLTYQWKSNNVAIPGATSATFTIPSVTSSSAATYTVEVNNPVGPLASASATLTVKVPTSAYEAVVAGTKPDFWLRYSETGPVLQETAANSGSLGASGTGLYIGAATRLQPGALAGDSSTAVSFSGGRVSVPYSAELNPAAFTIEAWLKPNAVNAPGTLTCPLSSVHIADPRSGWLIYQSDTGWNFRTYDQNGTATAISITGGPAPVVGEWYHVVATWDGSFGKVYVNGVPMATNEVAAAYVPNPDNAFSVGARNDGAFVWNGTADEVALYDTALSDAQILAHYENGTNASRVMPYAGLIAADEAVEYLRLNDAVNLSPATNSGTLGTAWTGSYRDAGNTVGSPAISKGQPGPQPPTYPGLESTNTSVTMQNGLATTAPFGITLNNVTMTCWIKREADFSTDDLSWLTWLGSSQSGGFHLNEASSQPTPGELRYHWDGSQWSWASGLIVPENVWTFCAMVLTPTNVTMYMSENGILKQASRDAAHSPHTLNLAPGFGGGQQERLSRNYIGQMDESTVHFRALSQSEITTMFLVGTGAPFEVDIVPGGFIEDSKPVGTPHNGANYQATWLESSTDGITTRNGVEVFSTANRSQITVPADADFNSTSGTFTFWMKADAPIPGPGNEGAMLVDRRTTAGTVIVLNDAGNIFVQCSGGANSFAAGYLPDSLWHHVAVTYDQSASGSIEIFVDGVSQGAQPNTAAWSWPATQPIELGRSHDGYWKRYDGQMDDFRIYNRILTQTEIASIVASDALVDNAALKLRFNFGTAGIGNSVTWPFGTLLSSPSVGPDAIWTPVPGAVPPAYPFLPTEPARFFRATP
ncbi:MAG TPA: LamG-like jellyroll fold domain-containing protein [Verrucomicrobiae bacterium]|nr:LamG-like jellyroll fold domain-containing protein [Verrucomicrobiae bacterium]